MPYIKVKVCQELYQELGLCPNMELVRSNSEGSIKFVPLPDKSVFDDYESPLLTSPMFGNRAQESVTSNSPASTGQISNDGIVKSTINKLSEDAPLNSLSKEGNASENIVFGERTEKNQPVSFEDKDPDNATSASNFSTNVSDDKTSSIDEGETSAQNDNPIVRLSPNAMPVGNNSNFKKLPSSMINSKGDNVCCIELDSRGRLSSVASSTRQLFSCTSLPSSALPRDTPLESEECSKKYPSDVSSPGPLKNCDGRRIQYPRKCENCFSVYKHCSSFIRHKKSCEEIKQKRLKEATSASDPETLQSELKQKKVNSMYPKKCDRCGLIFKESRAYKFHLRKCEQYRGIRTLSSNAERIMVLPGAVSSNNSSLGVNNEAKYILLKGGSASCRFFIRQKVPTDTD